MYNRRESIFAINSFYIYILTAWGEYQDGFIGYYLQNKDSVKYIKRDTIFAASNSWLYLYFGSPSSTLWARIKLDETANLLNYVTQGIGL